MWIEYTFCIIFLFTLASTYEVGKRIRTDRGVYLGKHDACNGASGEILDKIRNLMQDSKVLETNPIEAYIVPMNDAHQSEFVADHDKRLQFISKFTGSAGEAVITQDQAVLWVDSRYHVQAENQLDLDCWNLMKSGCNNVPSMNEWILNNLPRNSSVGVDPFLIKNNEFNKLSAEIRKNNISLIEISQNLIDLVWENQPEKKTNMIFPLTFKYSGKMAGIKIGEVLKEGKIIGAEAVVITALDDVAWLLNLRGSDISFNPVFFSYVILTSDILYFFVDTKNFSEESRKQLKDEKVKFIVRSYNEVIDGVKNIVDTVSAMGKKVLLSFSVSRAIARLIPEDMLVISDKVAQMKAIKNEIESENMINAHIRDGIALIQYLHWLNNTIDNQNVTELSGAEKLAQFRSNQDKFFGISFSSISAVGDHSAIAHYTPTEETNKIITRNDIYLIDSGGQYSDGTTDVTRTYHFGAPTEEEKMCYTRVLKGFISVATSVVPINTTLNYFDFMARRSLWQAGLNYGHGTGHGIGMFLFVHEYPPLLSSTATEFIMENMFTTNEPGFYKNNKFGIRIEDVFQVIKTNIFNAFDDNGGLTFKSITYAPIATNLILTDMLTKDEQAYVNTHNERVMDTIGPILLKHKLMDTHRWLQQETLNINSHGHS